MNPGKQAKLDKANILSDAARMVAQLRGEAEKLKESNEKLRENIKDLKVSSSYSLSLEIFLLDFRIFDALHMLLNVFGFVVSWKCMVFLVFCFCTRVQTGKPRSTEFTIMPYVSAAIAWSNLVSRLGLPFLNMQV